MLTILLTPQSLLARLSLLLTTVCMVFVIIDGMFTRNHDSRGIIRLCFCRVRVCIFLYDFPELILIRAGTFSFEPVTTFQIIESPKEVASISDLTKIFVSSNTVDVEVTDVLSKRKPQADRRATDICTTTSRKSFIDAR